MSASVPAAAPDTVTVTVPAEAPDAGAASPVDDGPPVLVTRDGPVTTLTLNRPARYNALSTPMLEALQGALDAVDREARVVVLAARGRAFCAGHDLREMRAHPDRAYQAALFERCSAVMRTLAALPQPVIARVQGLATAAGCQLVAASDLAVAASTARFAVSGIETGLFCATPSVALTRNVSRKRAFEMLVTGDFIDADEALARGLLNRVAPPEGLDAALDALTARILDKSAVAVSMGKRLFHEQIERPVDEAYALAGAVMADNMMSEDAAEGIDAFLGKRRPRWRHR